MSENTIPHSVPVKLEGDLYMFTCPHCKAWTEVEKNQVNCHIFRHGFHYVKNGDHIQLLNQMNPHAPKEECDRLFSEGKIVGCGKPFQFVRNPDSSYRAEICGYI